MQVTVGRSVHYRLSASDVVQIDTHHPIHRGRQVRNRVEEGQVLAAEVTAVFGDGETNGSCNLRVKLDGTETYWVTSRAQGDGNGQWFWPPRV